MDLIRWLLRLPVRLALGIWFLLRAMLHVLGVALAAVFGQMTWRAPRWAFAFGAGAAASWQGIRRRPRLSASVVAGVLLLGVVGWEVERWWKGRPQPPQPVAISARISAPEATQYDADPVTVNPLTIAFSGSVAPLDKVGKAPGEGVALQPPLDGTWVWSNDRTLTFTPALDWPVGQHYAVVFDRAKAFAAQVWVPETKLGFDSAPFALAAAAGEFYQDPQDALLKKAVFTLKFSHPVDSTDFEKRLTLTQSTTAAATLPRKFVVSYDRRKLSAFVHSEPLILAKDDGLIALHFDQGVHAAAGGPALAGDKTIKVALPGLYSLAINGMDAVLVDNTHFEPEQVLNFQLSQAIGEKEAAKAVQAWLLPLYHPDTPEDQRGDTPYDWSGDTNPPEKILKAAQKLDLEPVAGERDYNAMISFKYRADPGRYVFVRIAKGLESFGGYRLAGAWQNIVRVPDYPKMLRFMADGALLSLGGDKRVAVVARNVPGMKLEIGRVLPEQIQHLVSFNRAGTFAKPEFGELGVDNITERFEEKIAFDADDPTKPHYQGVDLGHYLGKDKRGVFLLKLTGYDKKQDAANAPAAAKSEVTTASDTGAADDAEEGGDEDEGEAGDAQEGEPTDYSEFTDSRLIVVTDLGTVLKKSLDGSLDVFVQSIRSGAPVDGAKVEILGKNGQSLVSSSSNTDGRTHFDALQGFEREKTPTLVVVKKGEDFAFLPYNDRDRRLDFSRFDIGGIRNARDAGQLAAYLFSDRGLYRPGETFHIGMIVRAADWARSLKGVPLQADIVDPRGLVVDTRKLKLGDSAFEELAYTTQETSPTGAWSVNLSLIKDGGVTSPLGSVSVQVKEFLPDRMKASAHLSREVVDGWVKPDDLTAHISLMNLFGTPAQQRRVEATLTLSPSWPTFAAYAGYAFFDPNHAKEGYSEPLGEKQTDDKGEVEYPLDLSKYGTATYRLHVLAKGYEAEGGRSVAAEAATLVSALDYLVGTKVDGRLDYIARDGKRVVNLIAIDPNAKRIAVDGLKAAIVERRYVSVLTKQDSGVYKYDSRMKEVPLSEAPLKIAANGLDFDLPTATPGSYALVVRNARGEELNRVQFAVAGEGNLSRSLERNAELELALSKHDYAPGEEIEVAIRAPYAGAGLMTLERDRVYAQAWFKTSTTGSVQKIRVPADFEGNGYVNVQFIRDPSSDEIFMSPLSYGVVPFSVNLDARRDAVTVAVAPQLKPGETLKMKVGVAKPARVAVFAVDEGILQVARYTLGDPLDFFFKKRMLEVGTSQTLDLILPEFAKLAGMAAPGGDEDAALGRHLNPFRKKHAPPVAYWSGLVDVKDTKELSWKLPDDFNGKLRVMAVAVAPDRVGTFQGATTVRGDFVLSPNVPAMVAPGDEFEVSVGVANNLTGLAGKELPISVKLDASSAAEAVGSATQELKLGELREGVALFRLRAKGEPGVASLVFSASSGDKMAKQTVEVSVRPAVPYRSEVAIGSLGNGSADVKPLRTMFDAHAKREAAMSFAPLVLARGLAAYLGDFPHRCTEQLVSQGMPALVFDAHPEFGAKLFGADAASKEIADSAKAFAQLIAVLRSRQNAEGGFGLWSATVQSERYVSAYAVEFLLEAKERGKPVPSDLLEHANAYLGQLAADESDGSLAGLRERAFAIYLLTRQGQVTTNPLAAVRQRLEERWPKEWKDDIAAAYLAASLQLLKQDKEAAALIAGPQKILLRQAQDSAYRYERYYDPVIRDSATLYLIARHFPERAKALPPDALRNIVGALQRGWYNTLSSAQTILALDAYASKAGAELMAKLAIEAVAADGSATPIAKIDGIVASAKFDAGASALRFRNAADANVWYSVAQTGFDRSVPSVERKEGIEILREFTDAEGHALSQVKLGDEVQVHLKIRATRGDGVGNIAIVDLLPGGFEPVQESHTTSDTPPGDGSDPAAANAATGTNATTWISPVGLASSSWRPEYADVRDDRVVIYGSATHDVQEFVYRIKATNAGTFVVPPAFGESMYDRTIQAQSKGGGTLVVERK
ncbi:MAG: alpha-2-macroglobulin [Dokdonella sp.]